MGDDLANQWGVSLCMPLGHQERMSLPVEDTFVRDRGFSKFRREVSTTLDGQFELIKVVSCGSDAQLYALLRASDGHLPDVLVGCGSYVSGTDSGLENWSTSTFTVHKSVPTSIMWPQDCETQTPKNHTVASGSALSDTRAGHRYHRQRVRKRLFQCFAFAMFLCTMPRCSNQGLVAGAGFSWLWCSTE